MTLEEIQISYLNQEHQFIIFNNEGTILESSNTLFDLTTYYGESLFDLIPLFEALKDEISMLIEDSYFSYHCMGVTLMEREGFYDIVFSRRGNNLVCVIEDRSSQYRYWMTMQQDKNEAVIDKELAQ